jgi:phosphate starvation-inducible protein PhoH and related proteins
MRGGYKLGKGDVKTAVPARVAGRDVELRDYFLRGAAKTAGKRQVMPKSVNQRKYLDAIDQHDIVFGIGPAGTGKTYLAMAQAVAFAGRQAVSRIILARPAVEAGEKLGFLPGDLQEKVNPYLRPLYDALYDMMEIERADRLLERGTIEVAPLAFMRGRTLNDAFVILDEAQNTTSEQMKMFLTRLGYGSKAVVTGDITQIDLPTGPRQSGLVEALKVVQGVEGISFIHFDERDVVRHPLVQQIVKAYEALRWIPTVAQLRSPTAGQRPAARHVVDGRGPAVRSPRPRAMAGRRGPARARGEVAVALVSDARIRRSTGATGGGRPDRRAQLSPGWASRARRPRAVRSATSSSRPAWRGGRPARPATLRTELRVLALHGLLHLLGYDHDAQRTGRMARAEARLRRKGGLRSSGSSSGAAVIPLLLFLLALAAVYIGTDRDRLQRADAAVAALMVERGGRDDRLGFYLQEPIQLFVPARLLLGVIFSLATMFIAILTGARACGRSGCSCCSWRSSSSSAST